jgi:hypothetical protein
MRTGLVPKRPSCRGDEQDRATGASLWEARSDDGPCAGFRLREADVRRFLGDAGKADPRDVHFTLPESPCVAWGPSNSSTPASGAARLIVMHCAGWIAPVLNA